MGFSCFVGCLALISTTIPNRRSDKSSSFDNEDIIDVNDTYFGLGRHEKSYSRFDNRDDGYSQSYDDFHEEQDDYDMMDDDF